MQNERDTMQANPVWEDAAAVGRPVNLVDVLAIFLRRWPFILGMALLGFIIAYAVTFLLTPRYASQAVFMPPVQQLSSTENPLAAFLKPTSSAIYQGLLLSDSVLDDVLRQGDLQRRFGMLDIEKSRAALRQITSVSYDATGFVTLRVTYKDPRMAQEIATCFLSALSRLNDRLAISSASQTRVFFQKEFERVKNDLEAAEVNLKRAQEASGVVSPQTQIQSGLGAIDIARANIRASQVELAALLQGQTEQSPEVVRLRSQIAQQQVQLGALEQATGGPGAGLSAAQAPGVNLKFVQLEREVKFQQVLFDVLARQLETAKLEESSSAPGVQVVDLPEVPLTKAWPRRSLFAAVGLLLGGLLAVVIVFIRDRMRVLRADEKGSASLATLGTALRQGSLRP